MRKRRIICKGSDWHCVSNLYSNRDDRSARESPVESKAFLFLLVLSFATTYLGAEYLYTVVICVLIIGKYSGIIVLRNIGFWLVIPEKLEKCIFFTICLGYPSVGSTSGTFPPKRAVWGCRTKRLGLGWVSQRKTSRFTQFSHFTHTSDSCLEGRSQTSACSSKEADKMSGTSWTGPATSLNRSVKR